MSSDEGTNYFSVGKQEARVEEMVMVFEHMKLSQTANRLMRWVYQSHTVLSRSASPWKDMITAKSLRNHKRA